MATSPRHRFPAVKALYTVSRFTTPRISTKEAGFTDHGKRVPETISRRLCGGGICLKSTRSGGASYFYSLPQVWIPLDPLHDLSYA